MTKDLLNNIEITHEEIVSVGYIVPVPNMDIKKKIQSIKTAHISQMLEKGRH